MGKRGHVPELYWPSALSSSGTPNAAVGSSGVPEPRSEQSDAWLKERFSRADDDEREIDVAPTSALASLSLSESAGLEFPPPERGHGARGCVVRRPCPRCCHVCAR